MTPKARSPLLAKFDAARVGLCSELVERDDEVDLALCALVAGGHLLLVGPPGCGKSMLLDGLLARIEGSSKFSTLLTKFTAPEEVLGPVSLAGLKEDRFRRATVGRLPEAHLAFLDEVFKASSAILNALLRVLNEGTFENGGELVKVPLLLCVAASNEWPCPETGRELDALFDRFLFRKTVTPVRSRSGRDRLLWARRGSTPISDPLTPKEILKARAEAADLPWSVEAKSALEAVLSRLAREGVRPGDRRQVKAVGAAQAAAWLTGSEQVEPEHLEVLRHVLWDDPQEQPAVVARVIAEAADPPSMRVSALVSECEAVLDGCDTRDLAQAASASAKLGEIERRLKAISTAKAGEARDYVKGQAKRLRLASLDAV